MHHCKPCSYQCEIYPLLFLLLKIKQNFHTLRVDQSSICRRTPFTVHVIIKGNFVVFKSVRVNQLTFRSWLSLITPKQRHLQSQFSFLFFFFLASQCSRQVLRLQKCKFKTSVWWKKKNRFPQFTSTLSSIPHRIRSPIMGKINTQLRKCKTQLDATYREVKSVFERQPAWFPVYLEPFFFFSLREFLLYTL